IRHQHRYRGASASLRRVRPRLSEPAERPVRLCDLGHSRAATVSGARSYGYPAGVLYTAEWRDAVCLRNEGAARVPGGIGRDRSRGPGPGVHLLGAASRRFHLPWNSRASPWTFFDLCWRGGYGQEVLGYLLSAGSDNLAERD